MRALISAIAGLVAVLAVGLALPVGWVAEHVADEDGYVAFSSDLVDDPQFRADVVAAVTDDVVERTGVSEQFAPPLRTALSDAAAAVVEQPAFREAFEDAQRQSHRAFFDGGSEGGSDRLVIDLAPVAQTIIDALTEDVPVQVDAPDRLPVTVGGDDERRAVEAIDSTPRRTALLVGIAAVAAGLSLLAARRRSTALGWMGAGTVLVAALVHVGADRAGPYLLERGSAPSDLAARAQQLLVDAALDSLDGWVVTAMLVGAGVALLGVLGHAFGRRRG
jgi:hypothetical protein